MNCNGPYATRSKKRNAVAANPYAAAGSKKRNALAAIPYAAGSKKHNAVANPYETRSKKRNALANNPLPTVEKTLLDLPYHIITDILIRLPAEYVFQCQRASKFLEILVTTPLFIRTHLARHRATSSIIAMQSFTQSSDREMKFYFIDERANKVEEANLKLDIPYMRKDDPIMLYDSYDGFLLLKSCNNQTRRSICVIWNPTTEEQVTITMEGYKFNVCGFYFNPHNKEYEVLLQNWAVTNGFINSYDVLSIGSKLRRNIGRYLYAPRRVIPPTIINGTLYWIVNNMYNEVAEVKCSNSIMAFEIRTNTFSTIRHGGASCAYPDLDHHQMHLIEIEGQLGLCVLMSDSTKLVLWVLNPATNIWSKTHTVTLPIYKLSRPQFFSCWPNSMPVEVVKMKDGKLLVRQNHRLLLCNLDSKTRKMVKKRGFEDDNFRPVVHTHSLVSLDTDKLIQLDS